MAATPLSFFLLFEDAGKDCTPSATLVSQPRLVLRIREVLEENRLTAGPPQPERQAIAGFSRFRSNVSDRLLSVRIAASCKRGGTTRIESVQSLVANRREAADPRFPHRSTYTPASFRCGSVR